jgi:putative transposase
MSLEIDPKFIITRDLDKGFGEIRRQLDYKCRWYGSTLVAVNPAYTSQRCSECGGKPSGTRRSRKVAA